MAAVLRDHLIAGVDLAARNGGDEFCAVVTDAHKTGAIERAQRFCTAVRATDFGVRQRITASVGVAAFPYDASDCNALLEIADAAMYHSKRSGRDCVSFAAENATFAVYA
jgi:diguanylate cyclase (GGDEF)-like protein